MIVPNGVGGRLALGAVALAALILAAAAPVRATERVEIAETEWEERCFDLQPGDAIHYSFSASDRLNFDVHYHDGETVHYPIRKDGVSTGRGAYTARVPNAYCLSWANPIPASVDLRFDVRVRKKN